MKAALISAALAFFAGAALADQPADREAAQLASPYRVIETNASVPFANSRVNGFQVGEDRSLIFRVGVNHWYRAEVWQPCKSDLKWTERIGFDPSPTNTLDRFAYVVVRGHRCPITSLDEIERPTRQDRAQAQGEAATAAPE